MSQYYEKFVIKHYSSNIININYTLSSQQETLSSTLIK